MSLKSNLMAAVAGLTLTLSGAALAGENATMMAKDAYARASSAQSSSGAAFMALVNHSAQDDRLIAAHTPAAKRAELHRHVESGDGVMQMVHVKDGFVIPAGEMHMLKRGGDHVMLMGLTQPFVQGDIVTLTLSFENSADLVVEVPVDLLRKPGQTSMDHDMTKHDEAATVNN